MIFDTIEEKMKKEGHIPIFGGEFSENRPDTPYVFKIFDKNGNLRAKVDLDEDSCKGLIENLCIHLGIKGYKKFLK